MALSDINSVTSYMSSGNYNSSWLSITGNAAVIQPQVYQKLFKTAGGKAYLVEMLKLLGNTIDVPDANITTVERAWPQRPIKLAAATAVTSAGAVATFKLHADSYMTASTPIWKVGDVIMVPAQYLATATLSSRGFRIHSLSTVTKTDDTATAYPLIGTGTNFTQTDIDTAIPANSYLMLAYNAFARGTTQPVGVTDSFTTRTHKSFISKWTVGIEGDVIARPYYPVTGLEGNGKFTSEKLAEAEFYLDEVTENAILFGEENDNTNIVETSSFSGSNGVASGVGIYQWADLLAQKHSYTTAISFDDFLTIAQLFDSQDIINSTIQWLVGTKFDRDLESAGLDWIKEFSSGTDLYDKMKGRLGLTVRAVRLGGLEHVFYNIPAFSKAGGAGLMKAGEYVYEFPSMALGIPMENVSYESFGGQPKSLPNVTLAYVNHNGENNRKVLKRLAGVSGAVEGLDVASSAHGLYYYMLTQYMIVVGECNKWVLARAAK
jgi:hypothetical protein